MTKKPMTRREVVRVLGTSAISALPAVALAAGRQLAVKGPASASLLQVALVPCPDYGPETLAAAVRAGWRSSRPPDVRNKRVVIKPNMVDVSPDRPIHTDPRLVEALILHLGDLGAREIVLAEGTSHNRDSESLFRRSGYEALSKRRGIRLVDLNYDDISPVKCVNPRATLLKELYLPETILSADVIISVPKMKTHKLAGITLSLKNMFGILPGMKYGWPKNTLHWNGIPLSICEINGTIKTHYSIVDGVVGMEGYGPIMGTPRKVDVLIMGDNALAVDATAARVMGVDPAHVDYLAMAHKIKLGSLRREDIAVAGEKIEKVRADFVLNPEYSFLRAPKGQRSDLRKNVMIQTRHWRLLATGLILGCGFLAKAAAGYIDPGTGSYVLQIAIAFLVGLAFSVKVFWKKISAFLHKTFSGKKGGSPDAS